MFAIYLLASIVAVIAYFIWKQKKFADSLPPGPRPLPIVGNLLQFDRDDPKKTFLQWHKKYGPIYTVWLGQIPNIFVTGREMLQELFVKRGDEFSDRPQFFLFNHVTKGPYGISSTSGETWKEQRRFSLQVLRNFGLGRKVMEEKITLESCKLIAEVESNLNGQNKKVIDIKPLLDVCVGSVISSIVFGKSYDFGDEKFLRLKRGMDKFVQLMSTVPVQLLASFPWLQHVPFYGKLGLDQITAESDKMMNMIAEEIAQHKIDSDNNVEPTDFTGAYVQELNRRKESGADMGSFSDWQLVCVISDLWGAGLGTTITTLDWAVLLMMRHPDVQNKVQKEISEVVGAERMPNMSDRSQMPYTCATIQELQRYANILAVNLPHAANNDLEIGGYRIPKGLSVIPQISVLHIDDTVYSNPGEFNPARFLETDGKSLKKCETILMPFSLGKRICMGEGLARMQLFIIFTSLLQRFSFSCEVGKPKPDLSPIVGFATTPKPYSVCIERRA